MIFSPRDCVRTHLLFDLRGILFYRADFYSLRLKSFRQIFETESQRTDHAETWLFVQFVPRNQSRSDETPRRIRMIDVQTDDVKKSLRQIFETESQRTDLTWLFIRFASQNRNLLDKILSTYDIICI